jgi:hypothetical protein
MSPVDMNPGVVEERKSNMPKKNRKPLVAETASRPTAYPVPWEKYLDMLRESEGDILSATAYSFTIPVANEEFKVNFPGGMTKEHWAYFAPHLNEWGRTLLAEGILRNLLQPKSHGEWCEALEPLRVQHGPDEEEWLPQLVEKVGFDAIAQDMERAVATFRATAPAPLPILIKDATGLLHSDDYRVCKDKAGNPYTCKPFVARVIEVLNLALKEGIPELDRDTLLGQAEKRCGNNQSLATEFRDFKKFTHRRLDHRLDAFGVWKTLVFPGADRGCYRLIV